MKEIWTHLESKNISALKSIVIPLDILDIVEILENLGDEERAIVFRLLSKDKAIDVFEELELSIQQNILNALTDDRVTEIINELEPDDRVKLFDEMPAKVTKQLLEKLTPEERKKTALLMGYEKDTAGRIMTPEYISVKKSFTVKKALDFIRRYAQDKETIYTIYVTDEKRVIEGVISLRELVMSDVNKMIADIMTQDVTTVSTDSDQEEVARLLHDLGLLSIPVVDREKRLVGIVTIDDAIEIIEEETTEDIYKMAGLKTFSNVESTKSDILVRGTIWQVWKVRLPFLLLTLFGGLLAGRIIAGFSETLESIAAVAIFIPIIMDMGGNAGTQSSTIFTRALVLGQIKTNKFFKHLLKELSVGLSMGIVFGILAGTIAGVWQGMLGLGLAVGLSLVITMTTATGLGFAIPYLLTKMGKDAAAGSDPIITTIKDITGLLIYFIFVSVFLNALL